MSIRVAGVTENRALVLRHQNNSDAVRACPPETPERSGTEIAVELPNLPYSVNMCLLQNQHINVLRAGQLDYFSLFKRLRQSAAVESGCGGRISHDQRGWGESVYGRIVSQQWQRGENRTNGLKTWLSRRCTPVCLFYVAFTSDSISLSSSVLLKLLKSASSFSCSAPGETARCCEPG